jgi:class 3 adenylate cyclase
MRRRDRAAVRGFVAKYMGDRVLVYFGYPRAHEDDAERAVRAGLELVAAIGAVKIHVPAGDQVCSAQKRSAIRLVPAHSPASSFTRVSRK